MGIKKYKIYQASSLSEIDMSIFEDNIRWNHDNSEFLVEYIKNPNNNEEYLNYEEVSVLIKNYPWSWEEEL